MAKISMEKLDRNMAGSSPVDENGLRFYDVHKAPFRVHGVMWESPETPFRRMPGDVAKTVSAGVETLHYHTSGGRIRFTTNSKTLAIRVQMPTNIKHAVVAPPLIYGFDVYINNGDTSTYWESIKAPTEFEYDGYTGKVTFPNNNVRDITLYMPCYGGLNSIEIGLDAEATVSEAGNYRHSLPVVFYGSSITQGAAASRPGNTYVARVARNLDCDYIDMGFSGNALGELEMARYLSQLPMSMFVMDYDHNSPDAAHLKAHHEAFFKEFRKGNPTVPVLMITRAPMTYHLSNENGLRCEIIRTTCENAKAQGDNNVYYLDGRTLFREDLIGFAAKDCTSDRAHPNDLGMFMMSCAFTKEIAKIMNWPILDTKNQFLK